MKQDAPQQRDYQLRGWAWALAWADLARYIGLEPHALDYVDQLAEASVQPDREPDATVIAADPMGDDSLASLWIDGDYIVWRRANAEQARRAYYTEPYPQVRIHWPVQGWMLNQWDFAVREARTINAG